jgi:hypothetical protein
MERREIITKLLNEGFSLETLSMFNDKQLSILSSRIISEQAPMPTVSTTSVTPTNVNGSCS